MINRINQRSLFQILENHKYFPISIETFIQRVGERTLRTANDFLLEQEDYSMLATMRDQKAMFKKYLLFVNIYKGQRIFIKPQEFYSKLEYQSIFKSCGIKLGNSEIESYIKIANGY